MYGDPSAVKILKLFRFYLPRGSEEYQKELTETYGVPQHLVIELLSRHSKCRERLVQVELKIYYSLISSINRSMNNKVSKDWSTLMTWQNCITYVDRLERLLQVRSPRAKKFRLQVATWKARLRDKK